MIIAIWLSKRRVHRLSCRIKQDLPESVTSPVPPSEALRETIQFSPS